MLLSNYVSGGLQQSHVISTKHTDYNPVPPQFPWVLVQVVLWAFVRVCVAYKIHLN